MLFTGIRLDAHVVESTKASGKTTPECKKAAPSDVNVYFSAAHTWASFGRVAAATPKTGRSLCS